jgi:sugar/nucleoside kinase (ribokinase family)
VTATPDLGGLLVIGDLMLDIVATPDPHFSTEPDATGYLHGSVVVTPGGSGLSIARSAVEEGWAPVFLLHGSGGRPGPLRAAAERAFAELADFRITSIASVCPDIEHGIAVIGYHGQGRRIMFGSPGANAVPYTDEAIEQARAALPAVDAVIVSGYTLFRDTTADGTLRIMAAANRRQIPVVLDVVPHSIAHTVSADRFAEILGLVDVVSSELNTLLTLWGEKPWPQCGSEVAHDTVERLLKLVDGVIVYPEFRHYDVRSRDGVLAEGWLDLPDRSADTRGLADRFLTATVRDHFIRHS